MLMNSSILLVSQSKTDPWSGMGPQLGFVCAQFLQTTKTMKTLSDPFFPERGFLNIQLKEMNQVSTLAQESFCLQAEVNSYPEPWCHWVTPRGHVACSEPSCYRGNRWVWISLSAHRHTHMTIFIYLSVHFYGETPSHKNDDLSHYLALT